MREYTIRTDGMSNTITTVTKDNYILVPNELHQVGVIDKPEWRESRRRVYSPDGVCPTLHGIGCGGNTEPKIAITDNNNEEENE